MQKMPSKGDGLVDKYFVSIFDLLELEVTKDKFIQIEEFCGFYPKVEGSTATSGFGITKGDLRIVGRIEYG